MSRVRFQTLHLTTSLHAFACLPLPAPLSAEPCSPRGSACTCAALPRPSRQDLYFYVHALRAPREPLGRGSQRGADPFENKEKTCESSQKNRLFFLQIISEGTCVS